MTVEGRYHVGIHWWRQHDGMGAGELTRRMWRGTEAPHVGMHWCRQHDGMGGGDVTRHVCFAWNSSHPIKAGGRPWQQLHGAVCDCQSRYGDVSQSQAMCTWSELPNVWLLSCQAFNKWGLPAAPWIEQLGTIAAAGDGILSAAVIGCPATSLFSDCTCVGQWCCCWPNT